MRPTRPVPLSPSRSAWPQRGAPGSWRQPGSVEPPCLSPNTCTAAPGPSERPSARLTFHLRGAFANRNVLLESGTRRGLDRSSPADPTWIYNSAVALTGVGRVSMVVATAALLGAALSLPSDAPR